MADESKLLASVVPGDEVKARLVKVLGEWDKENDRLTDRLRFLQDHNFNREAEWLSRQIDIRGALYISLCNKVLGVYF